MELNDAKTIALITHQSKIDELKDLYRNKMKHQDTSIIQTLYVQKSKEGTPQNITWALFVNFNIGM